MKNLLVEAQNPVEHHDNLCVKQINRCDSNQHISFKANMCSGSCSKNLHCKYKCLIMFDEFHLWGLKVIFFICWVIFWLSVSHKTENQLCCAAEVSNSTLNHQGWFFRVAKSSHPLTSFHHRSQSNLLDSFVPNKNPTAEEGGFFTPNSFSSTSRSPSLILSAWLVLIVLGLSWVLSWLCCCFSLRRSDESVLLGLVRRWRALWFRIMVLVFLPAVHHLPEDAACDYRHIICAQWTASEYELGLWFA